MGKERGIKEFIHKHATFFLNLLFIISYFMISSIRNHVHPILFQLYSGVSEASNSPDLIVQYNGLLKPFFINKADSLTQGEERYVAS